MKFTCEKSALSEAVMSAMRAVSLKSTIEALEGILVAAENGAVSVTGYDLESGICTTIEASVEEEGRVVLGARTLSEMVRKLPEGDVSVCTDDSSSPRSAAACPNRRSWASTRASTPICRRCRGKRR